MPLAASTGSESVCVDALSVEDRVRIDGANGVVKRVRGPHGPLGTPSSTDWYTLQVLFDECVHTSTVGPLRGDHLVGRLLAASQETER